MPTFRIPASTTNLGHGFDCLGMALGLYNTVTVESGGAVVTAPGSADPGLAAMAERMRAACAQSWGRELPGFTVQVAGDVPIARGMGSSSTILLGVAAACQRFAGRPLDRHELVELAAGVEGHPDNVAAACLGGFTVVGRVGGALRAARFAVPGDLRAVVAIPPFEVKTSEARAILPGQLSRAEHVIGLQRSALIVAALAQGDAAALAGCFADAWHEGHRARLNPGLVAARAAAEAAGAYGTILSGSGSTVLSFVAASRAEAVHAAVVASYRRDGVEVLARTLPFAATGVEALGA
jgi:homoserine kinase